MDIIEELEAVIRLLESSATPDETKRRMAAIRIEFESYKKDFIIHEELKAKHADLEKRHADAMLAHSELVAKNIELRPPVDQAQFYPCKACNQVTAHFITIRPSTLKDYGNLGLKERVYKCKTCGAEYTEQIQP